MQTNQNTAALADKAFAEFNFGDSVEVTDASGWQYITPGNERSRKVFVETLREDDGPAPRWTLTFTVRFDPDTGALIEAYALDEKGQKWGSMDAEEVVESNETTSEDANGSPLVSLDGGKTFMPAPNGIRIIYKDVLVPGEDEPGELHLNATSEGLISDLWVTREEHLVHNLGTSAQMLDDLVEHLVEDLPVGEESGPLVNDPVVRVHPLDKPDEWVEWKISQNLSDRWGDLNYHDAENKPLQALQNDVQLLARLRAQMWDELTFIVRKDGKFGILFEAEYTSQESEEHEKDRAPEWYATLKPQTTVVRALLKGMQSLTEQFPGVEFAVPEQQGMFNGRPAAWAFFPDGHLTEEQRVALGFAMLAL